MNLLILYGTLTFNTEMVSHYLYDNLSEESEFKNVEIVNVYELYELESLNNFDYIIFGTSSWGEGDPPPDTDEFLDKLIKNPVSLENTKLIFFGLGETDYEKFCGGVIKSQQIFLENTNAKINEEIFKIDGFPENDVMESLLIWIRTIIKNF